MKKTPSFRTDSDASQGQKEPLREPVWNNDIRAYYDAVAQEPVPQEFTDLMARIAKEISK